MSSVRTRLGEDDVIVLALLSAIFGGMIVFANLAAAVKIEAWFGSFLLIVPAGTIAYSVTFPITDIVDEVYGKRRALYIVWGGLATEIIMLMLSMADLWIQPAPFMTEPELACANKVFSLQYRIVLASITAYLVSQHHDVWAFWKWRILTRGKWLWLRNNASTSVSQLLDTTIFTLIAFYNIVPSDQIPYMVIGQWLAKLVIALLDTPAVYLGVKMINRIKT